MKRPFDIRKYKQRLREQYRKQRAALTPEVKKKKDTAICYQVLQLEEYQQTELLLCFVSLSEEIDTEPLINRALKDGKTVAVPYCVDGTRNLEFYKILSLEDLVPQTFGVREPEPIQENKIVNFDNSLCILPGLAFDRHGYRLGYGGGYYDRFLSNHYTGTTAGIAYQATVRDELIHGRFDVPCDYIITERGTRCSIPLRPT